MPKPRIEIDIAKAEQYAQVCDNDEQIARALGISPTTLYARKRESEEFAEALKRGRAKANVFVGGKLMELIKEGNVAATIFYLKSRCGWKETDRREITGADGQAVKVDAAPDLSCVPLDKLKAARELLYGKGSDSD